MPIQTFDFVPVPESKTAKNRVHVDLEVAHWRALEAVGATLLDPPTGDRPWAIMADPEGNELCAFPPADQARFP
jgi:hypothetical protein